jgi:hypothetical protein
MCMRSLLPVAVCGLITLLGLAAPKAVMAVDEPAYRVLKSAGAIELREYPGFIVAETIVQGDFDEAGRSGFRRIAGYIFGGNRNAAGESEKIAMTAPVTMEKTQDAWRLHFVMPESARLETLPRPQAPDVTLRQVGMHRVAAIRFSGFTTKASIAEQTERLAQWMAAEGLVADSQPQIARYNDPFTLPWNRRNEILIQVR